MTNFEKIMEFEPKISRELLELIPKIFRRIYAEQQEHSFAGNPENDVIVLVDQLRNMMFYEGIITDNQCFISNAYDLDRFIIEGSFYALTEVAEHIEEMLKMKNLICENNIITDKNSFIKKMEWYSHFKTETQNFTFLRGWNSITIRNLKIENRNRHETIGEINTWNFPEEKI